MPAVINTLIPISCYSNVPSQIIVPFYAKAFFLDSSSNYHVTGYIPDFDFPVSYYGGLIRKTTGAWSQFSKAKNTAVLAVSHSELFAPLKYNPFTHDIFSRPLLHVMLSNNAALYKLYKYFTTANIIFNAATTKNTYLNMYSNHVTLASKNITKSMPFASKSYKVYMKYAPKVFNIHKRKASINDVHFTRAFRGWSIFLAKPLPLLFNKYILKTNQFGVLKNKQRAFIVLRLINEYLHKNDYLFKFLDHYYKNNISKFIHNFKSTIVDNLFFPEPKQAIKRKKLSLRSLLLLKGKTKKIRIRLRKKYKIYLANRKKNKLPRIRRLAKKNCCYQMYHELYLSLDDKQSQVENFSINYLRSMLRILHNKTHAGINFELNALDFKVPFYFSTLDIIGPSKYRYKKPYRNYFEYQESKKKYIQKIRKFKKLLCHN